MIKSMLIAGCGGFAGTCGRFLMGKLCAHMFHGSFPMSTFMVNLLGCFLIGLFFGIIEKHHIMTPEENLLLITGFCGGFTTLQTTYGYSAIKGTGPSARYILQRASFAALFLSGQEGQSSNRHIPNNRNSGI